MPRVVYKVLFGAGLVLAISARIVIADTLYCELFFDSSIQPVSLKLDIFADGSASAVLDDHSIWIQTTKRSRLSSTEVFYHFQLEPKSPSQRESLLELYLSRFSLKLFARREDSAKGEVVSITEYNNMQCRKEAVIKLLANGT